MHALKDAGSFFNEGSTLSVNIVFRIPTNVAHHHLENKGVPVFFFNYLDPG